MFSERFIQYIKFEKRYSPHTVEAYRSDLDQFLKFVSHPDENITHPSEVTHHHIRNWMVDLMNQNLTPRSINRKIATLRKYFKFLVQEEVISVNPASKITTPKVPKHLPVVVEDAKLTAMLDSEETFTADFPGQRDKLVLELLFGTGMRLSELLGIKEPDINLYEGTVKVLGKRNKQRIIPLNNELKQLLKHYDELKKNQNFNNNSLMLI